MINYIQMSKTLLFTGSIRLLIVLAIRKAAQPLKLATFPLN